jgi:transposase
MNEVSIIGLDLAKNIFQAHGAAGDGSVLFRRKLSRGQLLDFLSKQPPCIVAMEACASAHHWGRAIGSLGHDVRIRPVPQRLTAISASSSKVRVHRCG